MTSSSVKLRSSLSLFQRPLRLVEWLPTQQWRRRALTELIRRTPSSWKLLTLKLSCFHALRYCTHHHLYTCPFFSWTLKGWHLQAASGSGGGWRKLLSQTLIITNTVLSERKLFCFAHTRALIKYTSCNYGMWLFWTCHFVSFWLVCHRIIHKLNINIFYPKCQRYSQSHSNEVKVQTELICSSKSKKGSTLYVVHKIKTLYFYFNHFLH